MSLFKRFDGCKACGRHSGYEPKVGDYVDLKYKSAMRSGEVVEIKRRWGVLSAKVALKPTGSAHAVSRWMPVGVLTKHASSS